MSNFRKFFAPLKYDKKDTIMLSIITFIKGINITILWLSTSRLVQSIQHQDFDSFIHYVLLVAFVTVLHFGLSHPDRVYRHRLRHTIYTTLELEYYQKFCHLDTNYTEQHGTGKMRSIIQMGVERRDDTLVNVISQWWYAVVSILSSLIMMLRSGPRRILPIMLGSFAVYAILGIQSEKSLRHYKTLRREESIKRDRISSTILMTKQEILQSNLRDKLKQELWIITHNITDIFVLDSKARILRNDPISFLSDMIKIPLIARSGRQVIQGNMNINDFLVITLAIAVIDRWFGRMNELIRNFSVASINIHKLRDIIDDGPRMPSDEGLPPFEYTQGDIVIQDLIYEYIPGAPVLQIDHLHIQAGQTIALVGPSWWGKSTLLKLLAWLLTPTSGDIIIDNQPLWSIALSSYYPHIGYVSQEPNVFDGSIYDNLAIYLPKDWTEDNLKKAISDTGCEFIYDFEHGWHTEIGERGVRLSWGQRQRLALAKLFVKNPSIIIIDEPTSALDAENERLITNSLAKLTEQKTCIVSAHRLHTVQKADQIIYMDHGVILETGTHTELMKQWWKYTQMIELQSWF